MKTQFIKKTLAVVLSLIVVMTVGCSKNSSSNAQTTTAPSADSIIDTSYDSEDLDVGYDESSSVTVSLNGTSAEISGSGAEFTNGDLLISASGTYVLSGSISDGQIIVDTDKESEVKLVLNGVTASCSDNAGLFVNKADKVTITLEDNSTNSITDGSEYSLTDDTANVDGAVFCRSDLTINGTGTLNVTANYKHAIVCKDDLVITDGAYTISSASGGIYGKDSIKINGGTFNITSGSNAVKSSNTEDAEKGYIYVSGGTFNITADTDGFEAATILSIEGGDINIITGGGSANASTKADGSPNGDWGQWGGGRGNMQDMTPPDGMRIPDDMEGMTPPDDMGTPPNGISATDTDYFTTAANITNIEYTATSSETTDADDSESMSAKALKAESEINIKGGTITIDSSDDSVNSNGNVNISGGTLTASSGDDGVHANGILTISDGTVKIEKSYEGLEGVNIFITGGNTSVVASGDGLNAAGGSDTDNANRGGMDTFNTNSVSSFLLKISGGILYVNASGDGLDSNGDLIVEGGEIYVSGPTNGGNGALDIGDNGSAWITGGTIIACGAVGMEETFGENNSTQYSVLHNLASTVSGGTEITITDSNGNTIITCTPEKDFQSVVFSSPEIKDGETYTITAGSVSETVTVTGISTSNSTGGFGGGGFGGGGRGQR